MKTIELLTLVFGVLGVVLAVALQWNQTFWVALGAFTVLTIAGILAACSACK